MKKESPFSKIAKKDISSHTEAEPLEEKGPNETNGLLKEEQTKTAETNTETIPTPQITEIAENKKEPDTVKEQEPGLSSIKEEKAAPENEKDEVKKSKEPKKVESGKKVPKTADEKAAEKEEQSSKASIEEKFAKIKKTRGVQISCYMDADISHEIDRIAEKTGAPKSQIINTLLREALFGD